MRSIRWSLVLYFLLLLCMTLGAVSYFSYQSTQNARGGQGKKHHGILEAEIRSGQGAHHCRVRHEGFQERAALGQKLVLHHHRVEPLYVVGMVASGPPITGLWNLLPLAESTHRGTVKSVAQMRTHLDPRIQPLHPDDDHFYPPVAMEEGEFYQTYFAVPFPPKAGGQQPKRAIPNPTKSPIRSVASYGN